MARDVNPPEDPEALAKLLGGQAPAAAPKGKPAKKSVAPVEEVRKLPSGKMGEKCRLDGPNGKPCPGRFTDLGGHHHDAKAKVTRTTLICTKCNVVQAQAEVRDLE